MQYPVGALKDQYDARDILFGSVVPIKTDLPRKFSLRAKQSPVPTQDFGSCVGYSAKALKEYQEKVEHLTEIITSGRFAYAMAKSYDGIPSQEGTYPRVMMKVLAGVGISTETSFPSKPAPATHQEYISGVPDKAIEEAIVYRINGFVRCTTAQELKQAIYDHGPVLVTLSVYDTFDNPQNGFIGPRKDPNHNRGGHAIIAIGWDDDKEGIGAFEIKNSWGTGWGDQGYGFVAYNYDGQVPFMDMLAPVDFVDATTTQGAPFNLALPVNEPLVVTQAFGANPAAYAQYGLKGHNGVDIRAKNKAPIFCVDDGEVVFAGVKGAYGNCVEVKHSWGLSLYAHLSSLSVEDSRWPDGLFPQIKKGTEVGRSGCTGNCHGEHLHLGFRINGVKNPGFFDWVDPMPYLQGKKEDSMILIKFDDSATVFAQSGDTLVGFVNMEAYNKFVEGREVQIVEMAASQRAKFKISPVVLKL